MGSLLRSEEMSLVQFFIQSESAYATVCELGELGLVEFRDLNAEVNAFQRYFVGEVRRCEEMERKLRFLVTQLDKAGMAPEELLPGHARRMSVQETDAQDMRLTELEQELTQMNHNEESLVKNVIQLTELRFVLREADLVLKDDNMIEMHDLETGDSIHAHGPSDGDAGVSFLSGVIDREHAPKFELVLWRSLRGNLVTRFSEGEEHIHDLVTDKPVIKVAFFIYTQGETARAKIRKICEAFGANLYPCSDSDAGRRDMAAQVASRLEDLNAVTSRTKDYRNKLLHEIVENAARWTLAARQEKAIFNIMNKFNFDVTSKALIAEAWVPVCSMAEAEARVAGPSNMVWWGDSLTVQERSQSSVPIVMHTVQTRETPPTYHRVNKFTKAFQVIVDAYGVAHYREINPTPFTIITFPFLFAVMFGDLGHGFIVTVIASLLVWMEKRIGAMKLDEMSDMLFQGRYIVLLMGIFSMYTGLIYNDIFSMSMEIFGTGWTFEPIPNLNESYIGTFTGYIYPVGLDPSWHGADNSLIFTNSYKMKMSVIFGVFQMTFGLILLLINRVHKKDWVSVFNEFVPQLIFLESIFGYLTIMIILKWCTDWTGLDAPSLLDMLINMFLSPGNVDIQIYPGQELVQIVLLAMALIAVPWMLLVKPLWNKYRKHAPAPALAEGYSPMVGGVSRSSHSADEEHALVGLHADHHGSDQESLHSHGASPRTGGSTAGSHGGGGGDDDEEGHDFGEIMVHQIIHTIEFCLGAISNTASYLRLWALSLAHAQLSVVLWNMTIGQMYSLTGFMAAAGMFGAFAAWFSLTLAILCVMEGLSAFLHALRLHWVEFNGKYYKGDGRKFMPFDLDKLDEDAS